MQIPNPVVNYGDECEVLNYRRRPAVWERGKVAGIGFENRFGLLWSWSYAVAVVRSRQMIYVGDDKIRKCDGGEHE